VAQWHQFEAIAFDCKVKLRARVQPQGLSHCQWDGNLAFAGDGGRVNVCSLLQVNHFRSNPNN
jgi:hypothetical protein